MENLHFIKYRKDESIVFSRENFDFAIIKDNNIKKIDKALEKVGFGSKALSERPVVKNKSLTYMSTNKCNLKCKYCYADEGTYGLQHTVSMTYEKYLEIYMKYAEKNDVSKILFFGGEPLLNFEEIKKFVDKVSSINPDLNYGIITNGTIMNKKIEEFLLDYSFDVTFSLDGIRELQNENRIYKDGRGTFDTIINNIRRITKYNKLRVAIESTISSIYIINYKRGYMKKIIQLFEDLNVNAFSFLLVITDDSELKITHDMEYSVRLIYREIVKDFFERILQEDSGLVDITVLSLVSKIITKKKSKDCSSGRAVLVDNKGDTYPCQMFYNSEKYNLGNVLIDDIEKINIRGLEVHNLNRFHVNECKNCIAKNICYSWCRGLNYLKNGEILSTIYEKCLQQRILLEETLVGLAKIKEHKDNAKIFVENYNKIIKKWENG